MRNLLGNIDAPPINVIYQTKTTGSYLSNKCPSPRECEANLVYQFNCHGCEARYIGQTKRHLKTRLAEHRHKSRESAIRDHALVCDHRQKNINVDEFKILFKSFSTKLQRKYYESICIMKSSTQLLNIKSKKKIKKILLLYLAQSCNYNRNCKRNHVGMHGQQNNR